MQQNSCSIGAKRIFQAELRGHVIQHAPVFIIYKERGISMDLKTPLYDTHVATGGKVVDRKSVV